MQKGRRALQISVHSALSHSFCLIARRKKSTARGLFTAWLVNTPERCTEYRDASLSSVPPATRTGGTWARHTAGRPLIDPSARCFHSYSFCHGVPLDEFRHKGLGAWLLPLKVISERLAARGILSRPVFDPALRGQHLTGSVQRTKTQPLA